MPTISPNSNDEIDRHQQKLIQTILIAVLCMVVGIALLRQAWRHQSWSQDYSSSAVPGAQVLSSEYAYYASNYGIAGGGCVVVAVLNTFLASLHWKRYVKVRRLYSMRCVNCGYDIPHESRFKMPRVRPSNGSYTRISPQMSFDRPPYNRTPYDDDFEDQPAQRWFHQWILGATLPACFLGYGIRSVLAGQATYGRHPSMDLRGFDAVAYGVSMLAIGLFLHFHYFWGNVFSQAWWAVLGKIFSAAALIASTVILIIRVGILGR